MELMLMKTRYTREGCKVTTVRRSHPSLGTQEEIILQAENLIPQDHELAVEEEDMGQWLTGGS